jgi:PhnB protein
MKMEVTPYLNFPGNCREAFQFYEKNLGGKIEVLQTHGETPMKDQVPADWQNRVMHAQLDLGGALLFGADSPPDQYEKPQGLSIALAVHDPGDAERKFKALAEGGTVTMPMQQTFWAQRFGMVTDRFGVPWMVNCPT